MSFMKIVVLGGGAPPADAGPPPPSEGICRARVCPASVDDTDREILRLLRADGRATNRAIGQKLGLTEGAIRQRVARMTEEGILLRYTIIARPLGPDGLVLIRCRPGATEQVVERVRTIADDLFETSGEYDLAASVAAESMEAFNRQLDRIRSLSGVEETATLIRLTRFVGEPAVPVGRPSARGAARSRRSRR